MLRELAKYEDNTELPEDHMQHVEKEARTLRQEIHHRDEPSMSLNDKKRKPLLKKLSRQELLTHVRPWA
jgi:hypothetical protein